LLNAPIIEAHPGHFIRTTGLGRGAGAEASFVGLAAPASLVGRACGAAARIVRLGARRNVRWQRRHFTGVFGGGKRAAPITALQPGQVSLMGAGAPLADFGTAASWVGRG